jgi:hypothetical protein
LKADAMRILRFAATGLSLWLLAAWPVMAAPKSAASAATPAAKATSQIAPDALQALRRMSAYLGALPVMDLTSQTSVDVVTVQGQRVQLDGAVHYKIRRPDAFVVEVDSDKKKRTFFYDGKQFTVFAPSLGFYATVPAPPTILQTLAALEAKFGIELPLEDLVRWSDPTADPAAGLISGFAVGPDTLDGVATDQYAFRNANVDWQIWIQRGDKPLPLKVVIVDRTDPTDPNYVARLTWNASPAITQEDFTFRPGKDAKPVRLTQVGQ